MIVVQGEKFWKPIREKMDVDRWLIHLKSSKVEKQAICLSMRNLFTCQGAEKLPKVCKIIVRCQPL